MKINYIMILVFFITFLNGCKHDKKSDVYPVEIQKFSILKDKGILKLDIGEKDKINNFYNITSDDSWIYFSQLKPSKVNKDFLKYIKVNGIPAELDKNIRLTPKAGGGTLLIPHSPHYRALTTFNEKNHQGESRTYSLHRYYRSIDLAEDNDKIQSFVLKHGYMATFSENDDGTGASKVYIAKDSDIEVNELPDNLKGKVSFIRVFPWRWTGKKGFGGWIQAANQMKCDWFYNWNASGKSTLDVEYVPMKHRKDWDLFSKINELENVTHLLGFNEPMQEDQADMSMEECLEMWPKLQASGLRLGSPCPTDGDFGWLFKFIEEADKRGLRVDFVAVHFYWPNWTGKKLVEVLQRIHKKTGRPIWLTEFNHGAPWTNKKFKKAPTNQETARKLKEFAEAMNGADFIERYAVFNFDKTDSQNVIDKKFRLTVSGKSYRDVPSVEAEVKND